jgi:hypothetical protein
MSKHCDRGAARATLESSRSTRLTGTRAAGAERAAVTSRAALNDVMARASRDAELLALLVALRQQHDIIANIEAEGHHLPAGITDVSRDQERRLEQALDRCSETLDCVIATQAATPDGLRVKAEALGLVASGYAFPQEAETLEELAELGSVWHRLALSLACDMLAWSIDA